MEKSAKYRASSLANFTDAELARVKKNVEISARRAPEEHAKTMALIKEKGLSDHREVVGYFLDHCYPMTEHEISTILMYADTSYVGSFGRGEQFEAPSNDKPDPADLIYRPAIKPDGA